eukprot:5970759-Ditylum_brightwellii.AAC.1
MGSEGEECLFMQHRRSQVDPDLQIVEHSLATGCAVLNKVPKIEVVQTLFKEATGGEYGDGCHTLLCCCNGETHDGIEKYYAQ